MQTKFQRADVAVALVCLIIAVALLVLPLLTPKASKVVLVIRDRFGNEQHHALDEDAELTLSGDHGHHLTLTVKDGRAYVSESSCPDGLCQRSGTISRVGETLVCLPAGIAVSVSDRQGKAGEVDATLG